MHGPANARYAPSAHTTLAILVDEHIQFFHFQPLVAYRGNVRCCVAPIFHVPVCVILSLAFPGLALGVPGLAYVGLPFGDIARWSATVDARIIAPVDGTGQTGILLLKSTRAGAARRRHLSTWPARPARGR